MNKKLDVFYSAIVESADDSILELNPILKPLGYHFVGYEYEDFISEKLEELSPSTHKNLFADDTSNNSYIIDDRPQKRHQSVLELLNHLNIQVDFNRTSFKNKVFFFERSDNNEIESSMEDVYMTSSFEIVCNRLTKLFSVFLEYPLQFGTINKTSTGISSRMQYLERTIFKAPNSRIFQNRDLSGLKRTENPLFINLVQKIIQDVHSLKTLPIQSDRAINVKELNLHLTEFRYIDFAIELFNNAENVPVNNLDNFIHLKVKLTLLITCLESFFNNGTNPISHTIARHYSILFWNPGLFDKNYRLIKYYYSLRSKFVHGAMDESPGKVNKDIKKKITTIGLDSPSDLLSLVADLRYKVKVAIELVLMENKDKTELFSHLNARGIDPNEYYPESGLKPKPY